MEQKVSIVVPVYNVEKYLKRCVDSLIGQSYPNLEILLVDDGSKDSSLSICKEYELKDSRIRALHKENEGLGLTRNYGIERATGKYITFVDSDDYLTSDAVEAMLGKAEATDADVVIANMFYKDEEMKYDLWSKFPLIEKKGYTIVGWYADTDDISTEYKNNQTYTESVTYKAKWAHVTMLGAQGKLVVDGKSGIRFGTKIYNDGDEIIEKGTLILPVSFLNEGEGLRLDTPKVAKSVGKVNYEVNKDENYVTYLGTIINIPEAQFHRQMTAAAYVIYKDKAGNKYTVYSQYPNESTSVYDLLGNNVDWNEVW